MNESQFMEQLSSSPESIEFVDTMTLIDAHYNFTPMAFSNGDQINAQGENSGSCKIFAFAKNKGLSKQQTLSCFGAYYREDVLANPDGNDHQNIRNFMKTGWDGINFSDDALTLK
ncbi:MAG: HopJ type III effector protein [Gammaproteobacteria bacterium]|nr:HopJ type III effector protein [Gammaproteobacteria bacterium]